MIRIAIPGLALFIVLAAWIYAMFDVVQTERLLVRKLPKQIWVPIVVLVPVIGPLAWLLAGRPLYSGWAPGGSHYEPPTGPLGPEDLPGGSSGRWPAGPSPEDIQRWEDEFRPREDGEVNQSDGHDDV